MKQIELLKKAILLAETAELRDMLTQILNANTPEVASRFNIFEWCATNDRQCRHYDAVTVQNGAYYATNSNVLLKLVIAYPQEQNGKLLYRNGETVEKTWAGPNFDAFLPAAADGELLNLTYELLVEKLKLWKALPKNSHAIVKIEGVYYDPRWLLLLRKLISAYPGFVFYRKKDQIFGIHPDGHRCVVMPYITEYVNNHRDEFTIL